MLKKAIKSLSVLQVVIETVSPFRTCSCVLSLPPSLSLGGNAGLAATRAAAELATPISVYVPTTTREVMRDILRKGGADVYVHGKVRTSCSHTHQYMY